MSDVCSSALLYLIRTTAQHPRNQVHVRRTDKASDKEVIGSIVKIEWPAALLDNAVAHDQDLIGHGHCFDLVVRDVYRGGTQALMQRFDFGPHLHTQLCIQRSEEHTSELQSLMRISYAVFCLTKKK